MTDADRKTQRRDIDLPRLKLLSGSHAPQPVTDTENAQWCLLEAVAFVAGEPWSDHPACVSPVLGAYGRALNDVLPDDKRQRLVPLIPNLIGTAGDGKDETRSYMALDWLIRVYTPVWLRLVPALVADADLLAGWAPIDSPEVAASIGAAVRTAASHSVAARDDAGDAAWDDAGDAARDAARAAAGDAGGDAAGDAAWDAAWDAARAAARAAAGDAGGDAAWVAARAAAGDAAWDAAWVAAWDAAWAAARDALAPTVDALQDSAIALFPVLIAGGTS